MTEFHPTRLGLIASILQSNVDKKSKPEEPAVELCNYTDVYYNDTITADLDFMKATASPDQVERLRLAGGDVIITKDSETADDIGIPAYVESTHDSLVCGYHLTILRPRSEKVFPKFLYYSMLSRGTSEYWEKRANGVTRVSIPQQTVSSLTIPLPDLETQRRIADYLDKEISEMDALIDNFEKLITALESRKSLLVKDTFDSLNADTTQMGLFANFISGRDWSDVEDENGEYPVFGSGNQMGYANDYLYDGEAVIFGRKGTLNKPRRISGRFWVVDTAYIAVPNEKLDVNFFYYWAQTLPYDLLSTQTAIPSMTATDLKLQQIPIVPLAKQREIAGGLDSEFEKMNGLIEDSTQLVSLLKERKTALITEVVTGRKEV